MNLAKLSYSSNQSLGKVIDSRTGWHIGGMMNIGLPLGLSVQPELSYSSKGADGATIGYLEIPVDVQWGITLPFVRPYVAVTPYISYKTNNSGNLTSLNSWDGGIGLGGGVDIWKLQVAVKYMWGLGKVVDATDQAPSFKNRNVMLSVGFFL